MQNLTLLKEHILQLEERLLKPEIRTSLEELDKLLAEDFCEYGSSGNVWNRQDYFGEGGAGVVKMTLSHFEMHTLAEDTVFTTYRIYNETKDQHTLRSSIWKNNNGQWQMVFHQGTPTA
ncbi:DUF4440 domain-containing protein [Jeotgalibacillus soli]|uniref:RNAse H n=1 Tax=Jeotgalibacillus soli TaxID=889306 RepID=A0A0C2VWA6_9BACL|nr:DUF4440 domain-containing protein [Jeotgalibacillus soli]KIL48268.1 RNAse H [Jeotgalibacillus soli]